MKPENFTMRLLVDQTPETVFETVIDVRSWWSGLFGEEIKGDAATLEQSFTFRAGGGAHYSKQKLIELIPGKKVVWLVTDSNLSFLEDKSEWTGTKIGFDIAALNGKTSVTFTHQGLVPTIECYDSCSGAWSKYLQERLLGLLSKKELSGTTTATKKSQ